ncbi:MAG: septum formation protein Maf [Clostridia bacterium]|nr:septum formation protein Maf [Clostridia bacterium]
MKIVLASGSPRRKEILTEFGYAFSVEKSNFVERDDQADARFVALKNAEGKANDVFLRLSGSGKAGNFAVVGADTVVFLDGVILGKPKDRFDAVRILKMLSGKTHTVVTGYCVLSANIRVVGIDETIVCFNELPDETIGEYIDRCKPFDKAGSYGIQDGFPLVNYVKGSLYNVIGFPIEKIKPVLDGLLK